MTDLYKILRFRRDKPTRTVKRGLTLKEAKAWTRKSSTHGDGWFDGFTKQ